MKNVGYILTVFCVPLFLLTGCALTRDSVSIEYRSLKAPQMVPRAEKVAVGINVQDQRTDKSRVSCKKNGYGMEMASIICEEDIVTIINQAIAKELSARGFILEKRENPDVIIDVQILKFYNDFKVGFVSGEAVAELIMHVHVANSPSEDMYTKHIVSIGNEKGVMLASGKKAKLALEDALQKGVAELMEDPKFMQSLLRDSDEFEVKEEGLD